jgi:hypothetical protein
MSNVIGSIPDTPEARFIAAAVSGNADAAIDSFAGEPAIDDPFTGALTGESAVRDYVDGLPALLLADDLSVQFTGLAKATRGSATEVDITRTRNGRHAIFHAVLVSDLDGERAVAIRIYYRRASIDDTRSYRRYPLLTEQRDGNELHPFINEYVEVLKHRSTSELLDMFEDDASFGMWKGKDELRRVFDRMYTARTKGVILEHPNTFFDGTTTCIEFNSYRADGEAPHPGVALYEVGESGRLVSARPLDE